MSKVSVLTPTQEKLLGALGQSKLIADNFYLSGGTALAAFYIPYRHLYFLKIGEETIKTEFTYYPFPRIEAGQNEFGLTIDSLLDIAVNKLFTIYQQPRARDFMDLYMICREKHWPMDELMAKAKIKFDWHIDPVQLGAQFFKVEEVQDYPRLLTPLVGKAWQEFFKAEAEKLKSDIFD